VCLLHALTAVSDALADAAAFQFIWSRYFSHCTVSNVPSAVSALWNSQIVFSHDNMFGVSSFVSDASLLVMGMKFVSKLCKLCDEENLLLM
jgi:hypothetical protein